MIRVLCCGFVAQACLAPVARGFGRFLFILIFIFTVVFASPIASIFSVVSIVQRQPADAYIGICLHGILDGGLICSVSIARSGDARPARAFHCTEAARFCVAVPFGFLRAARGRVRSRALQRHNYNYLWPRAMRLKHQCARWIQDSV